VSDGDIWDKVKVRPLSSINTTDDENIRSIQEEDLGKNTSRLINELM